MPLTLYKYRTPGRMAEFIQQQINSIPRNATIAVVVATETEAESWFKLLEDELASGYRPPRLSRRDDLTRRINVHFAEVRETKGLEFDVVIVPDLGAFALGSELGRNQAYVAITRPKQSIILGCREENAGRSEIEALVRFKLMLMKDFEVH